MSSSKRLLVGVVLPLGIGGSLIYLGTRRGGTMGSRMKLDESSEVSEVLRKIDPVDSLYFDVSVARHMLEEGDHARALEWLNPNHALGELKKAYESKLLTTTEFDKVGEEIIKIKEAVDTGKLAEAHTLITPLQGRLAEKAYTTFKELNPNPGPYINKRYEAVRERKVTEWRAKGYPEALIEKGLKWGNEWSKGIAERFIKDPALRDQVAEGLYPESLTLSERWIEAMMK